MTWKTYARREHAPLSARLLQEAQRPPYFGEVTGIQTGLHNHVWLEDTIYIPSAEQDALRSAVQDSVPPGDWTFLTEFCTRCRDGLTNLHAAAVDLADASAASHVSGLLTPIQSWFSAYQRAMAFVPIFRTIDRVLASQIPAEEAQAFLEQESRHVTEETRERSALADVVAALRKTDDLQAQTPLATNLLAKHAKEFGWLRMRWYLDEPFGIEDFRRRVVALLSSPSMIRIAAGRPLDTAGGPRDGVLDELSFLRSHRAEAINKAIWVVRPALEAIGQQYSVGYHDVTHLFPEELLRVLDGDPMPEELTQLRQSAYATVLVNDRYDEASGPEAVEALRRHLGFATDRSSAESVPAGPSNVELKGVAASQGRAVGRVRLIHSQADDSKVEVGDILVTTMTYPSLVGAMQRSAAIVTDDGGLLSHAAVTARELGKPCLIDTGRATVLLHDGDLVEVDCDSAVVRRLESANNKSSDHQGEQP